MIVKNLSNTSFDELLNCFLLAFNDYFVPVPTEKSYYENRWKAAKVDFNCSYGMFDNEKLVGFIIHAIDKRNGTLVAFNTGTGVIPEYRGRRIVKAIYEHALRDFVKKGVEKSTLEVITKNDIAIRLYKGVGFETCKKYKCFKGKLKIDPSVQVEIREMDVKHIDWTSLPNQQLYSWDNQKESIVEGNYRFFHVLHDNQPESFFIIDPDQGYLPQFDLLSTEKNGWKRLFSGIKQVAATIKINNVDERLKEKLDNLRLVGLNNSIDQFEMEMTLTTGNDKLSD
ncbi:GNAT family N-acetyltransferase [Allomuricauda sp. SCSIO 65647]|uniref:GNAT family N-acetyltransferase n=1 Tax=Allomuricauda sp. SCSIO 65647 TaxID=2908843 RepID=UPI001F1A685F|nr:GNAT family N-acetyltransferase [Muricauda sp. SCSIO 65647]UJH67479.1 GNAT family N-acetyltransferase [Muricauda sp. SCSIO 65647]